jgi:glycosyltransferase involved in cell wall biosynthesis
VQESRRSNKTTRSSEHKPGHTWTKNRDDQVVRGALLSITRSLLHVLFNAVWSRKLNDMHVLVHSSNPPSEASGYGTQMRVIVRALMALGHSVTILANGSLQPTHRGLQAVELSDFVLATPPNLPPNTPLAKARFNARILTWVEEQPDAADFLRTVRWVGGSAVLKVSRSGQRIMDKTTLNDILLYNGVDLYISFYDIFVNTSGACVLPALALQPLHFYPLPHSDAVALADFDFLVGISSYGTGTMKRAFGIEHGSHVARHFETIPHSRPVRTLFKPLPEALDATPGAAERLRAARAPLRAKLGIPRDAFVIVCAGSGSEASDRKKFFNQIQAACAFMQERDRDGTTAVSGDAFLYLHTEALRMNGAAPFNDIPKMLEICGEHGVPQDSSGIGSGQGTGSRDHRPVQVTSFGGLTRVDTKKPYCGRRYRIVAQDADAPGGGFMGRSDQDIAAMLRCADVVLHATASEGFGVGVLEAQACGTPVVTTACTAMFEMTRFGIAVPPAHLCPRQDFNSAWAEPDVKGITAALHAIEAWTLEERVAQAREALRFIHQHWDDAAQTARWTALLPRIEAEVVTPLARAPQERAAHVPHSIRIPPTRWLQLCAYAKLRALVPQLTDVRKRLGVARSQYAAAALRLVRVDGLLQGLRMGAERSQLPPIPVPVPGADGSAASSIQRERGSA